MGAACCVMAFFLLERGILSAEKIPYYAINALGASLVLAASLYEFDGGDSGVLVQELCWIGISVMGMYKIAKVRG